MITRLLRGPSFHWNRRLHRGGWSQGGLPCDPPYPITKQTEFYRWLHREEIEKRHREYWRKLLSKAASK